jgi:hypothetical protein
MVTISRAHGWRLQRPRMLILDPLLSVIEY